MVDKAGQSPIFGRQPERSRAWPTGSWTIESSRHTIRLNGQVLPWR